MKKGKYLILGLFPVAIAAGWLHAEATRSSEGKSAIETPTAPGSGGPISKALSPLSNTFGSLVPGTSDPDSEAAFSDDPGMDVIGHFSYLNADPKELIGVLEQLTGKTALLEQKLPTSKISIEVQEPLSRYEAIKALESVLSLNGVAVIDMGEKFFKAVTSKAAISQSPEILDESLANFEATQRICSKFFKLHYYDANEFQKLLKPILTPSSSNVIVFGGSNSLFITDTMANLQRVENLIQRTDTPINMVEEIRFIPMNNVKASAVVKKIEQLKRGALKKYLTNTTIDSDDSSNQLIVITPKENLPLLEKVVKQLDNKCEHLLHSEVIRIKHGEAKKIAEIVTNIIKEQRQRIEKENQMAFERQQVQLSAQGSLANALAQAASGSRSNQQISNSYSDFISTQQVPGELKEEQTAQFSANLTLASDERSNSIIVYGTSSDLAQVGKLIASLDVLLDQVRIEVIVAQVIYTQGQQSGLESFNFSHGKGFGVDFGSLAKGDSSSSDSSSNSGNNSNSGSSNSNNSSGDSNGNSGNNNNPDVGFLTEARGPHSHELVALASFGNCGHFSGNLRNFAMNAVFEKAKTDSNVKILSNPTLVTTHNRKANFKIGTEQPFVSSSAQSDEKGSKERVEVIYKNVGIDVTVTPLIGSNGIIQLDIKQEVSQSDGDFIVGSFRVPKISKKEIESFVSVASGDVIVLAGFKERVDTRGKGKLFLLGDIPLLGDWLFTPRNRDEKTSELILFIKPTVVLRPQDEAEYLDRYMANSVLKPDIDHIKEDGNFAPSKPFPKDTIFGLAADDLARPELKPGEQKRRYSRGYYRSVPNPEKKATSKSDLSLLNDDEDLISEDTASEIQREHFIKDEVTEPVPLKTESAKKSSAKTKAKKKAKTQKTKKSPKNTAKKVTEQAAKKDRKREKSLQTVTSNSPQNVSSKKTTKKQSKKNHRHGRG